MGDESVSGSWSLDVGTSSASTTSLHRHPAAVSAVPSCRLESRDIFYYSVLPPARGHIQSKLTGSDTRIGREQWSVYEIGRYNAVLYAISVIKSGSSTDLPIRFRQYRDAAASV